MTQQKFLKSIKTAQRCETWREKLNMVLAAQLVDRSSTIQDISGSNPLPGHCSSVGRASLVVPLKMQLYPGIEYRQHIKWQEYYVEKISLQRQLLQRQNTVVSAMFGRTKVVRIPFKLILSSSIILKHYSICKVKLSWMSYKDIFNCLGCPN